MSASLFDKLWDAHVIEPLGGGLDMLRIDRHLLHDLSGPGSLKMLQDRGLPVRAPELTFATPDHGVSTEPGRPPEGSGPNERAVSALRRGCAEHGIRLYDVGGPDQGIVHVIGPELGLTLPGLSIVCGDSHTCTQGAFGALAWGIGSTEIMQVLATQALIVERPRSMRVVFTGRLSAGVTAKDLILSLIGEYGAAGGAGHAIEFAGEAVEAMSMEARMSLCNLAVEFGARFGFVAPDETTFAYLKGRRYAPQGEVWDQAESAWRGLRSDPQAPFDTEFSVAANTVAPQVTWGVSPEHVIAIDQPIADPSATDAHTAEAWRKALDYMGLKAGGRLAGTPVQHVFIGSCANARLSDLVDAAEIVRGRRVAKHVRAWVVPGSQAVKRAAEAQGLDRVFTDAGFEWREPGCSMCLAVNGDRVPPGERAISTSNRNFVGRQGPGARTHLASPIMAAAAAVAGHIVDVRDLLP
jgi:3-isopropylmalate/(R)-2-methylmalate dehydratase large subunit